MKHVSIADNLKPRTQLKRIREARSRLTAAREKYPELAPLEALLADLEAGKGALADQSIRNYRQSHLTMASTMLQLEGLSGPSLDEAMAQVRERVYQALAIPERPVGQGEGTGSRASPNQRAAKLDIKTAKRLIAELKRHALARGHMASAWAVFYIVSAARIGWRPVELQGAEIRDKTLWIKTAKIRNGGDVIRPFPLERLPSNSAMAATVLVNCLPDMVWLEFERWRNGMAEALSQACDRLQIARVSLYMFRHIAIQTWRGAGISAADIAALAGHFNLRTASRHYGGRATAGWMEGFHLAQDRLYENEQDPVQPDAEPESPPVPVVDWDDFPVPAAPAKPSGEGARNWKKYRDGLLDAPTVTPPITMSPLDSGFPRPRPRRGPK